MAIKRTKAYPESFLREAVRLADLPDRTAVDVAKELGTHPLRKFWAASLTTVILLLYTAPGLSSEGEAALWNALRSGVHIALLRHAIAPGMGDPADFTLGDCGTQRNLSDEDRDQAARIGMRFRANGIKTARVLSLPRNGEIAEARTDSSVIRSQILF